jgi:hypothetical protein
MTQYDGLSPVPVPAAHGAAHEAVFLKPAGATGILPAFSRSTTTAA